MVLNDNNEHLVFDLEIRPEHQSTYIQEVLETTSDSELMKVYVKFHQRMKAKVLQQKIDAENPFTVMTASSMTMAFNRMARNIDRHFAQITGDYLAKTSEKNTKTAPAYHNIKHKQGRWK